MLTSEAVAAIEEAILECRYDHQKDNAFEAIRVLQHLASENEQLKKQLEGAIVPKFKFDDEIFYFEFDDETDALIIKQGRVWQLKISPTSHLTYMVVGCTGTESICGVQGRFCFATKAEAEAAQKSQQDV